MTEWGRIMKKDTSASEMKRRQIRRKRRQRNQILAYVVLVLLFACICIGVACGIKKVTGQRNQENQQYQNESEEQQEIVEEMFASEEAVVMPSQSEEIEQISPEEQVELLIEEQLAQMSLAEKVAGLFFVTPEAITGVNTATQAGDGTKAALEKYPVGGLIYFKKNIETKEQIIEMIHNSQEYSKFPLFIGVDEEGGNVNRVAAAGLALPQQAAYDIGVAGDPEKAYQVGKTIGGYLQELGFNVNFAPVADIANVDNSVMKNRAYGSEASEVWPFVTGMMKGLHEYNVTACLKHFPGIGSTTADTHEGLASTDRTGEQFRAQEFEVFKAGIDAGAQMIMVGHVNVPALDDSYPASMSKAIITDILREELNFDGVIITDAMNMSAVSEYYSSEQAAIMALKAGCDMILMPENFLEAYAGVITAVTNGTISEERVNDSLRRIYRIKFQNS